MAFDSKFIDSLLSGSIPHFEKFIRNCQMKAYRISYNILKDRDMVEEVIQDGMMRFYEAIRNKKLDRNKNIESYFLSCVRSATIDLYRKNKLYMDKSFSSFENKDDGQSFDVGRGDDFLTSYERIMDSKSLWVLLNKIPIKFREVLLMIEYEGMSAEEVAEITNANVNTVRWRLFRAKEMLKNVLMKVQASKLRGRM